MYTDPADEWRALADHYRSMSDDQLRELAEDFSDLRPAAQQTLRDEMKLRKLGDPQSPDWRSAPPEPQAPIADEAGDGAAVEYTWKTPLCGCDSREEAWQIREVLRRARIESWMDGPQTYIDAANLRVLVAADQLDDARRIIALPIPADVIEESQMTDPEFELPVCPECGAPDPTLESAEPSNEWKCESCGAEWADDPPEESN